MQAKPSTIVSSILPTLVSFASNHGDPDLRRIGLEALATLEQYVEIGRDLRAVLVSQIWKSASDEELEEAFSGEHIEPL